MIDQLIINSPYEEPREHWLYIRETQEFKRMPGRRKSGYWRSTARAQYGHDDPGEFVPIELVNQIRPRVKSWRENGYPNITGLTRKLLAFWKDETQRQPSKRLFWC